MGKEKKNHAINASPSAPPAEARHAYSPPEAPPPYTPGVVTQQPQVYPMTGYPGATGYAAGPNQVIIQQPIVIQQHPQYQYPPHPLSVPTSNVPAPKHGDRKYWLLCIPIGICCCMDADCCCDCCFCGDCCFCCGDCCCGDCCCGDCCCCC